MRSGGGTRHEDKKDAVTRALGEAARRRVRLRALARLTEMAERGDFEEFAGDNAAP